MSLPLILGSSSPSREMLLRRLQVPFVTANPNIDETPHAGESVEDMVIRLAREKAHAVAKQHPHALIIGCDQVASVDGIAMGKPSDHAGAVLQLQQLSGQKVRFMNGLCLLNSHTQREQTRLSISDVYFRTLTLSQIEQYLQKADAYGCAASLKVEALGIALLEKIEAEDPTTLIGLSLMSVRQLLEAEGVSVI